MAYGADFSDVGKKLVAKPLAFAGTFDESGNVGDGSFYTEFGFGQIRDIQSSLENKLGQLEASITGAAGGEATSLQAELERLRLLLEERDGVAWWAVALLVLAGAGLAATGSGLLTWLLLARRPRSGSIQGGS